MEPLKQSGAVIARARLAEAERLLRRRRPLLTITIYDRGTTIDGHDECLLTDLDGLDDVIASMRRMVADDRSDER